MSSPFAVRPRATSGLAVGELATAPLGSLAGILRQVYGKGVTESCPILRDCYEVSISSTPYSWASDVMLGGTCVNRSVLPSAAARRFHASSSDTPAESSRCDVSEVHNTCLRRGERLACIEQLRGAVHRHRSGHLPAIADHLQRGHCVVHMFPRTALRAAPPGGDRLGTALRLSGSSGLGLRCAAHLGGGGGAAFFLTSVAINPSMPELLIVSLNSSR